MVLSISKYFCFYRIFNLPKTYKGRKFKLANSILLDICLLSNFNMRSYKFCPND